MRYLVVMALIVSGCSSDSNNENSQTPTEDMAAADTSGEDMGATDTGGAADQGSTSDVAQTFCEATECTGDTPNCSPLLERCVQCTSNNDCGTAPLRTCETMGDGMGGDPSYECVECVDDSVCAGGTCDLATHTCM